MKKTLMIAASTICLLSACSQADDAANPAGGEAPAAVTDADAPADAAPTNPDDDAAEPATASNAGGEAHEHEEGTPDDHAH